MDLSLMKYHIKELRNLLMQEPNNPRFEPLYKLVDSWLVSSLLANIEETKMVPIIALQQERKRTQALERLLKKIQKNPAYPDELKADIAKAHRETMRKYRRQTRNPRQTPKQAI